MHQGSHHLPSMHSYLGEQFQMTITLVINPHTLEYTDIPTITMIIMCTFVFIYTVYIYICILVSTSSWNCSSKYGSLSTAKERNPLFTEMASSTYFFPSPNSSTPSYPNLMLVWSKCNATDCWLTPGFSDIGPKICWLCIPLGPYNVGPPNDS